MFSSETWVVVGVIAGVVTTVGVVASAWITWLNHRSMLWFNLPKLFESAHHSTRMSQFPWVSFRVEVVEGKPEWMVTSVSVSGIWPRRYIGRAVGAMQDAPSGQVPGFELAGCWRQRVDFDPGVVRNMFLVHPKAPQVLSIRFSICLSSSPRKRSSITKRVRIPRTGPITASP